MNANVEIVYFMGCPNASKVFQALKSGNIPFGIVIQDRLPDDDPRRSMSSPSVLVNGVQVVGTQGSQGCTFSDFSEESVQRSVKSAISGERQ